MPVAKGRKGDEPEVMYANLIRSSGFYLGIGKKVLLQLPREKPLRKEAKYHACNRCPKELSSEGKKNFSTVGGGARRGKIVQYE